MSLASNTAHIQPADSSAPESLLAIGQVLNRLTAEFPDLTPSKLRFLEDQGLISPARTKSGYRKFSQAHLERLRMILTLQRDHYLPLKVIANFLAEVDAGGDPVIPGATQQRSASSILTPHAVLTRAELLKQSGANTKLLSEAISAGLVPAAEIFTHDTLDSVTALVALASRGISPNHLRGMRPLIDRDIEFIERVAPITSAHDDGAKQAQVVENRLEIADLLATVRGSVVRTQLQAKTATRRK